MTLLDMVSNAFAPAGPASLDGAVRPHEDHALSSQQLRLWLLERLYGAGRAYNVPYSLRLHGKADAPTLQAAVERVIERHDVLRTTFLEIDGRPVQRVRRFVPGADTFVLREHDLSGMAEQDAELRRLVADEADAPFDLEREPLIRGRLVRLAASDWVLLLTMHHIVSDAHSFRVLAREIGVAYAALLRGEAPLPPLATQYAEYAAWQQATVAAGAVAEQEDYWRRALAGAPERLELPTDFRRPATQTFEGDYLEVELDEHLTGGLRKLGLRRRATLFSTVLAAWGLVLSRLSGQTDVVVGITTANRRRREDNDLIGFFANTLPVRLDFSGRPTLGELMRQATRRAYEAKSNQDVPFERIVTLSRHARSTGHAPLVQAMLTWLGEPDVMLELPGVASPPGVRSAQRTSRLDLTLRFEQRGNRLTGGIEYATSLFERATVVRFAESLRRVLEEMVAADDQRADLVDLVSAAERAQLVDTWNATDDAAPRDVLVHEWFERQVDQTPHAVAVVFHDEQLSYAELNRRANRLAHRLRTLGVGPDVRVALCLGRSVELVIGALAVLKAGGAYVPLDPEYPTERLRYLLADSAPAVVLTVRALAGLVQGDAPLLLLDDEDRAPAEQTELDPAGLGLAAEHLAYVIYTSGSTGKPKGVMVAHCALANHLRWRQRLAPLEAGDALLQKIAVGFDVSVGEMFWPLLAGARLVVAPPGAHRDPDYLAETIDRERITTAVILPRQLRPVVEHPATGVRSTLRHVVTGGEALPDAAARAVLERLPRVSLYHEYGLTETTVTSTGYFYPRDGETPGAGAAGSIGRPVANTRAYVLDAAGALVSVGVVGELWIGGAGVARGYHGRAALTAERFAPDPFGGEPGARLYRTGDLARWRRDGTLEFLGRNDFQVKIRGFRVELGEIEARLAEHAGVEEAVVVARHDGPGEKRLVAYYVGEAAEPEALRTHLLERLPEYMVPAPYVRLDQLPLTPNGKVDRRALPAPPRAIAGSAYAAPRVPLEATVAAVWGEVLGVKRVGVRDNFFDLGGHSLLLSRVQARLSQALEKEIRIVDLFRHPTVAALAAHLEGGARGTAAATDGSPESENVKDTSGAFAIIGMAGRFPGAPDVERFWSNLRDGVHAITFSDPHELAEAGIHPSQLAEGRYVGARGVLEGMEWFDAAFFGFSPREAEILDPQQRIFLETAWEALESAGHAPGSPRETVGIFAGSSNSDYLTRHVAAHPELAAAAGSTQVSLGNAPDFLVTRAAYKLNLRGPALNIQTACSTGLVAVHVACRALAAGECDVAIAGGVGVRPARGHVYSPGGIMSPDGYCRAFDARAEGTVGGNGIGLVVIRRLADALAAGDTIRAVIRGSAVNNDGDGKIGFTAPSVDAHAEVVARALAAARVAPETIGFVEAHGSGTVLGDPVEVTALAQAFGPAPRRQSVALGSVKTSIGHLDAAAGAAGLIKAVLALEHGMVPPTLHFTTPNPAIDFAASPFFVNTELAPWPAVASGSRRAGVSSLGLGGTNAHVVLEEAPPPRTSAPARRWHVLTLSARTPVALEAATDRLAAHLRAHPARSLADVAYTLQTGRRAFEHRRILVAADTEDAASALETRAPDRVFDGVAREDARVGVLFPGLGNHHPGMGRGLYETEPVYREVVDRCAEILLPYLGEDLRHLLYGGVEAPGDEGPSGIDLRGLLGRATHEDDRLASTRLAQPALFVTEYALARLWMQWGVTPAAIVGHSLGEYVAATVAGVWSLEDALRVVAERARLIEETPPGGMMGLGFDEAEVAPYLRDGLSIGAKHGPSISVVSGPAAAVDALQAEMTARGVVIRRLPARHAYHSPMMEPVAERLAEVLRSVRLHPPRIPFASNVTGTWITAEDATDPAYWTRHLCGTVRWSEGIEALAASGVDALMELGPGNTLGWLALKLRTWGDRRPPLVVSLRHQYERVPDDAYLLGAVGRAWTAGAAVDWEAVHAHERLRRVPLPTYPFQRGRYWIERATAGAAPDDATRAGGAPLAKKPDPANWLHLPVWTRTALAPAPPAAPAQWLVLADAAGIGGRLAGRLEMLGHAVVVAEAGDRFGRVGDRGYTVRPGSAEDLFALRDTLHAAGLRPRRVVHLWGIDADADADADAFARAHARGYATVAALAAAFAGDPSERFGLTVVTERVRDVYGGEPVRPERATVLGPCLALPLEHPHLFCRTVDVRVGAGGIDRVVDQLAAEVTEVTEESDAAAVALRGPWRWTLGYDAVRPHGGACALRPGGAYLFVGGMAGGGEVLAEHLAEIGASLAVIVDPAFPDRAAWDAGLASGGAVASVVRGIRAAEARGGRTLLLHAAAGDAAALSAAVAAAREAFGGLHGLVHTGHLSVGGDLASPGAQLARIPRELAALETATEGLSLDFRFLQNSIFSVFGGASAAATAAFALLDAWAQQRAAEGGARWTSVGWDRWHLDDGDAASAVAQHAILREDGARVYQALAALADEPRVVVSTHDVRARLDRLRAPEPVRARPGEPGGAEAGLHERPALANEYFVPTGDAEKVLAGIWGELLGIRDVGVRDSFFELGGHSLVGIKLLSRIRDAFHVDLPLPAIFEAPTIAQLAALIDEAILRDLDAMSDEEAEAALAGMGGPAVLTSATGA